MKGAMPWKLQHGILRHYRKPVPGVMVADPAELGVLLQGNCAGEGEPDSSHMLSPQALG
jgi:hypothetical protein